MAAKADIGTTMVIENAYEKTYSTGSSGFFGKMIDPSSGAKYQVTAVRVGSKPKAKK